MASFNAIGTMRYGWTGRTDGTADTTVWFVLLLFPVVPIRGEQVRVLDAGIKRPGVADIILGLLGHAVGGFESRIEVLGPARMSYLVILRTYLNGWIIVPCLAVLVPLLWSALVTFCFHRWGLDFQKNGDLMVVIVAPVSLLWPTCVLAWVLDRAVGRHHLYSRISPANRTAGDWDNDSRELNS